MTRCLQALSVDQDLQQRLRSEFAQARLDHGDGDLDYESLQSLPFLDGVIKESLRLYVTLFFVDLLFWPDDGQRQIFPSPGHSPRVRTRFSHQINAH